MVWVAVFALVCMAAVGVALLGIAAYLLYALTRHLVPRTARLLHLGGRKREAIEAAERAWPTPSSP